MKVNIYIGSSLKGWRKQDGVVGFVLEAAEHKDCTVTQFGRVKDVTENEAYLKALKYALKRVKKPCGIEVWMDNGYIANVFARGWFEEWKKNGWVNAKGKEVASRPEWEKIAEILGAAVPVFHVGEGHSFKGWLADEVERRAKKYV